MELPIFGDAQGVKLEIVGGLPVWEAFPLLAHQEAVDRIRESIKKTAESETDCGCFHYADVYVRFPDGSLKRPDISVFCEKPLEREEAIKQIPDAVIEVLSRNYEAKDLKIGVPFYLENNIKDVVVFNPYTMEVMHYKQDKVFTSLSPTEIMFDCGCRCTV
jgi:Uma2 family endonuclease